MVYALTLPQFSVFETWRAQARALASNRIAPENVSWRRIDASSNLFEALGETSLPEVRQGFSVPKAFLSLAETAICHASEDVFSTLYRLMLRLIDAPETMANPADPDVNLVMTLGKSVSRDAHKMKAFVRFKEIGSSENMRRCFASWFEPDHYIVEHTAGFFIRRFADMDWIISTPHGNATSLGGTVTFSPFAGKPPAYHDATDDLWRTYYANIFNPARLKIKAMQSEMPKKYWRNLPEAELIPGLVRQAEPRAVQMRAAEATPIPAHLQKFKAPAVAPVAIPEKFETLSELHAAARNCRRCDLCRHATQTVCGEGPRNAPIMFVGEQPGDKEDLHGKPFIGPAGQILMEGLGDAGINRSDVYITNAVKHFKFKPRGKRRIHERPNSHDIAMCRWLLELEIELVKPRLIVAMGSTALQALTGDGLGISSRRGHIDDAGNGSKLLITYHPSAILRSAHPQKSDELKNQFLADITLAAKCVGYLDQLNRHHRIAPLISERKYQ